MGNLRAGVMICCFCPNFNPIYTLQYETTCATVCVGDFFPDIVLSVLMRLLLPYYVFAPKGLTLVNKK